MEKAKRRGLADLGASDRELAVMRKCRLALEALSTPDARVRVVEWLKAVMYEPPPPPPPAKPDLRQTDLPLEDPLP